MMKVIKEYLIIRNNILFIKCIAYLRNVHVYLHKKIIHMLHKQTHTCAHARVNTLRKHCYVNNFPLQV